MYMVFNVGCIECGVSSNVVGVFANKEQAEQIASKLNDVGAWREGGQNSYEVFKLNSEGDISEEYLPLLND